jgi:PGF-pre-PGF domain-containing protein
MANIKHQNKIRLLITISALLLILPNINAFTTNGTDKTFEFDVTSGKNSNLSSSNFNTFIITGDIAGTINSSSFKTELGLLRTMPYLDDEPCKTALECVGDYCCSNLCSSSSCPVEDSGSAAAADSGGGGGGGGGAGGGVIPTGAETSESQLWSIIPSGSSVSLTIDNEDIAITRVDINNIGYDLTNAEVTVIALMENPVAEEPSENVYQYISIDKKNIADSAIGSIEIGFRIPKSWLTDNNLAREDIALFRYDNDNWNELSVEIIEEDAAYINYGANIPGLSYFVIGMKSTKIRITPGSIKVNLMPGLPIEETLTIKNTGSKTISISLDAEGIEKLVSLSEDSFDLEPGKSKTVIAKFRSSESGSFIGKITASGLNFEKSIPVIIESVTRKFLFDIILEVNAPYKIVRPGDEIKSKIILKTAEEIDVTLNYLVKDLNNNIVFKESEKLTAIDQLTLDKSFRLPKDLEPGLHALLAEVIYADNTIAISSEIIEVITKVKRFELAKYIGYKILIYIILITIIIVLSFMALRYFVPKYSKMNAQNLYKDFKGLTAEFNSNIKSKNHKYLIELYNQIILTHNKLMNFSLNTKIKSDILKETNKIKYRLNNILKKIKIKRP